MSLNHKTLTNILLAVTLMGAALAFSSCGSKKGAAASQGGSAAATEMSAEALAATYKSWDTFYAPMSMSIAKPMSLRVSGRTTMVKDQCINMSLRMLGIEVAVVYVDTDSAFLVDKYHKAFVATSVKNLTAKTGITLGDLQGILLGQAVYPGKGVLSGKVKNLFSASHSGDFTTLTPRNALGDVVWYLTLAQGPVMTRLTVEPDDFGPFTADFSEVTDTEAGNVASDIVLAAKVGTREAEASIEWNLRRAEWNKPRTVGAPSLKGYRRMSVSDLIKTVKSL